LPAPYEVPTYGSDVMADAMRAFKFPFLSLNPGSSFRGLHDSLVNYANDEMQIVECPHEKIAVALAHGYAKATGRPMGVVLHNVVGLLHGAMAIYYAYIDRVPVVVFGGSGPAAYDGRRPNIDWIHGANVQGNAIRDYTKWDYEPRSLESVPTAIARGYRIATSEPAGPVYIALDAGLQEQRLDEPVGMPNWDRLKVPSAIGPDPAALSQLADAFAKAERPVIIPGYVGRDPDAFELLVRLADTVGAGVIDTNIRHNFPNRHPLCVTGTDAVDEADCVLFLDVKDMQKPTHELDSINRKIVSRIAPGATVLDLGFNDVGLSSWSEDYTALVETDLQVTADTTVALPLLVDLCDDVVGRDAQQRQTQRSQWRRRLSDLHDEAWRGWAERVDTTSDQTPVSTARLASAVWEVARNYDWVLTAGTASEWAKRVWNFDKHYRTPGRQLGTATQIGISLGVALAHKGTGRLVIDLQPDGDLMFDAGALWVASYYELPLLVVMFNNRAYYNDWEHQVRLAKQRGTPVERVYIGMEIDNPAPDFASLARSFSWHAEGPITDPADIEKAVQRAAEYVQSTGKPALVDVVCQPK
jgi:acetolactate synthase I/II/III large subunit